jgi:uncharacterized Fe-S cluster protein YjdI
MEKKINYSNGEVTVIWKPEICIHSAKCVQSLPEVFKPRDKPWVQMEHSNSEAIINAVKKCPSGALTYTMNSEEKKGSNEKATTENSKVEVLKDGPLLVSGPVCVVHDDGREEIKSRTTAFCRCGRSENKPFCDGTHKL